MDELQELFLNNHGEHKRQIQFNSIAIASIVIMFFSYYYDNSKYAHVIILVLFALFIANKYVTIEKNTINDFNEKTMFKLNSLQNKVNQYLISKVKFIEKTSNKKVFTKKTINDILETNRLDSLYIDANIIHFLYSILPLNNYNQQEFYLLLKGTNHILKIRNEIEIYYQANGKYTENISEMFEIALELKKNVINNVHNFIYAVPKIKIMNDYVNKVIEQYSILISYNINLIHKYYLDNIKLKGINVSTKFVSYNNTKPFDKYSNHETVLQKQDKNKLIQFYI
jgi:hypothetical protein